MKKIFIGILFLMILCLSPLGREQGYAATETADGAVGIKAEYTSLEKGSTVKIHVCINKEYMGSLDALVGYDKAVFEQITSDDIDPATKYESGEKLKFDMCDYLESDESGVKSITGTDSKIVLVGNVQFDSNIFSLDSTSNTISVAAGKFEVAGESKETERKIIGNESDTFDDLTLHGLRSGIKEIKQKTLNLDSVGPGLTVKEFIVNEEPVNKITLDIKENSSLMIDSEGKLDLG